MKILIFFIVFFIVELILYGKTLIIYYYERPPYYYTTSAGVPSGLLINRVKKILNFAKLDYKFEKVPVKRIFTFLKQNSNSCSPGWYKTETRLKMYKYTLPIYVSNPIVAVINSKSFRKLKLPDFISIKSLFEQNLTLGLISGFNYGKIIENAIKNYKPKTIYYTISMDSILMMVARDRIDYTLVSRENLDYFFSQFPETLDKLKILRIKEVERGNKRYIICSKNIDDEIIKKINNAIKKLKLVNYEN